MRANRAWFGLTLLMLPTLLVAMDMTALILGGEPTEWVCGFSPGPSVPTAWG